jgi:uncharacterized Zn-finger protein
MKGQACTQCGFVDGTKRGNYVLMDMCRECREKNERAQLFAEATENGTVTCDGEIMCPYCGDVYEDIGELHDSIRYECDACGKTSDLSFDYTTHCTTTKKVDA